MDQKLKEALAALCPSVLFDVDMGHFSTLRTGGIVSARVEACTLKELENLVFWLKNNNLPWRVVGGGSNILVGSSGFNGVFIRLGGDFSCIEEMEPEGSKRRIVVGAGCSLAKVVSYCVENHLAGLEWATGIPGTIGGAMRMNAGAFGASMADCIATVRAVNDQGKLFEQDVSKIKFSYRETCLQGETKNSKHIIVGAVLQLRRADKKAVLEKGSFYRAQRSSKQPKGAASAGSFFKNPPGDAAGRLIEAAGLKGLTYGGAKISEVHANFIVNTGTATPADITSLMKKVQSRVYEDFGIKLEPEVHIIEE